MFILRHYQASLKKRGFVADAAQLGVLERLARLHQDLLNAPMAGVGLKKYLSRLRGHQIEPVKGLYLWGGVGRGKTYLFDLFYESLPFEAKLRLHFHRFMRFVHDELKSLRPVPQPLDIVARHIAAKARVLCLDEYSIDPARRFVNMVDDFYARNRLFA
jgi:cell division protein ZapE